VATVVTFANFEVLMEVPESVEVVDEAVISGTVIFVETGIEETEKE